MDGVGHIYVGGFRVFVILLGLSFFSYGDSRVYTTAHYTGDWRGSV